MPFIFPKSPFPFCPNRYFRSSSRPRLTCTHRIARASAVPSLRRIVNHLSTHHRQPTTITFSNLGVSFSLPYVFLPPSAVPFNLYAFTYQNFCLSAQLPQILALCIARARDIQFIRCSHVVAWRTASHPSHRFAIATTVHSKLTLYRQRNLQRHISRNVRRRIFAVSHLFQVITPFIFLSRRVFRPAVMS